MKCMKINPAEYKILVVDDVQSNVLLLKALLGREGFGIVYAMNGTEALEKVKSEHPDLILLDVMMPDMDGFEVAGHLKVEPEQAEIPIIFLTALNDSASVVKGFQLGANDFISKPFGVLEFSSRIRAILRRKDIKTTDVDVNIEKIYINLIKREVVADGNKCNLTYKEYELLRYLAMNKGIVLTRDKIMESVWGFDFQGESRTVDMHIKTLRQKLGQCGNIIQTVRNVGYKVL